MSEWLVASVKSRMPEGDDKAHGHWDFLCRVPGREEEVIMCSNCGHSVLNRHVERPRYCANCGAVMDGGNSDSE